MAVNPSEDQPLPPSASARAISAASATPSDVTDGENTADVAAAMQQMGIVGFVEAMHQQMDEMEHRLDSAIDGPQAPAAAAAAPAVAPARLGAEAV